MIALSLDDPSCRQQIQATIDFNLFYLRLNRMFPNKGAVVKNMALV
jgi:hypothetical protein